MNFLESLKHCIDNSYANFKSRASRSEFWYFTLFILIYMLIGLLILRLIIVDWAKIEDPMWSQLSLTLGWIVLIAPVLVPSSSVTVRRLHDINLSGWLLCIYLPFMYLDKFFETEYIFYLVFTIILYSICLLKGTNGKNKFGNKPKK